MKLFYIVNARIPTEKAHGIQIMKMSEAIGAKLGVNNYTLILPGRIGSQQAEDGLISTMVCGLYGIKTKFKVRLLPVIDFLKITNGWPSLLDSLAYFVETISFGASLFYYLSVEKPNVIYTRDFLLLPILLLLNRPIYYETHFFPTTKLGIIVHKILIPRLTGIVVINNQFLGFYKKLNINPRRILVAHNGSDPEFFQKVDKAEVERLRRSLGFKPEDIVIGYIGRLSGAGQDKGKQILLSAMTFVAKKFSKPRFLIVGERNENMASFTRVVPEKIRDRFVFTGIIPYNQMPLYFNLLEIGIIPFPGESHFKYFMSPLKLFDYLAAGKPIVTSDLPSVREILTDKNAVFVKPGDSQQLASAIGYLVKKSNTRSVLGVNNFRLSQQYTWVKRAKRILDFIFLTHDK